MSDDLIPHWLEGGFLSLEPVAKGDA